MSLRNEIMLITYCDSLGGNLGRLEELLERHFDGAIGGIHLLPFFPSSADRGFAPIRYDEVDAAFGTWDDIARLAEKYDLAADFMINHISRRSEWFQDFLRRKDESPYAKMFIRYKDFWPNGEPTEKQLDLIYKRKPRPPYTEVRFHDGTTEKIWCTFDDEQIDLDLNRDVTNSFIRDTLIGLAGRGISLVRLDAFAYSVKMPGTNCFFVEPDVWNVLDRTRGILAPRGVEILPEIHEHYSIQLKLARRGYRVYDFALPMLVLHALHLGTSRRLVEWLRICPRKQFTTLDTHDGIGVVDVKGLLGDDEIDAVKERLFTRGANVKRIYNTAAYNNLDIYQINSTYYSALGCSDDAYILARAIQFFTPGIPQVYYVGLLAGENDVELVERTKTGRDINRHSYTADEVERQITRQVVRRLLALMRFRNSYGAFEGDFTIEEKPDDELALSWRKGVLEARLTARLPDLSFEIRYIDAKTGRYERLEDI